jgi:hypothetical protein
MAIESHPSWGNYAPDVLIDSTPEEQQSLEEYVPEMSMGQEKRIPNFGLLARELMAILAGQHPDQLSHRMIRTGGLSAQQSIPDNVGEMLTRIVNHQSVMPRTLEEAEKTKNSRYARRTTSYFGVLNARDEYADAKRKNQKAA